MVFYIKKRNKFIILDIILLSFIVFFIWSAFIPLNEDIKDKKVLLIEEGMGLGEIGRLLKEEGTIRSNSFFNFYAYIIGKSSRLQAGKYYLSPSMSVAEIVDTISKGNVAKYKITIIEGWNNVEIAESLKQQRFIADEDDFLDELDIVFWKEKYPFLEELNVPDDWKIEGFLFPDTYYIHIDDEIDRLIDLSLDNFSKKFDRDLIRGMNRQNKELMDIVIMASILEREVRNFDDKKIISGILWKRIESGIPLQTDATLTYVTGKGSLELTKDDLVIDSPFNTYRYSGLPPFPISNPSLESIKAAIYPEESIYWFYLHAPDGKAVFSKTLQDHLTARWKYYMR